jgi:hypothetical protein
MKVPAFNYWKAVGGFVAGLVVAYLGAKDGGVTGDEWLKILVAGLGGGGLVTAAPKNRPRGKHADGGQVDLGLALLVVILVCVVLLLFRVHF